MNNEQQRKFSGKSRGSVQPFKIHRDHSDGSGPENHGRILLLAASHTGIDLPRLS